MYFFYAKAADVERCYLTYSGSNVKFFFFTLALYEAVLQTKHKDEIITLTLIYQMKFNATLANINKDAAGLDKNNLSNNTDIINASIKCISSPV